MNHQDVFNIAEHCARHGIERAVISPGSRSALLTLSFARHPEIACQIVPDERAAGFTALGMSQGSGKPVALVCTSGTAAANYYPAIIEAYYSHTPLVVFTADRPPELTDQQDGQTIRQENLYANHIKRSYNLPVSTDTVQDKRYFERLLNEGLNILYAERGPVHFNVPIREPFYPDGKLEYQEVRNVVNALVENNPIVPDILLEHWNSASKILIVPGQSIPDTRLPQVLKKLSRSSQVAIVADHISNSGASTTTHHDLWLNSLSANQKENLKPDLVLSFGNSIISKSLKIFLRENAPAIHWKISDSSELTDTYFSISHTITGDIVKILEQLPEKQNGVYQDLWQSLDNQVGPAIERKHAFSEWEVIKFLAVNTNAFDSIHLSNSMPVRYSNFVEFSHQPEFLSNRGTSGIDGSTSTAIGFSLTRQNKNLLLTGDVAFLYDSNAFWQNILPGNLKIVVVNNLGGGIFRIIPGPSAQPELEEYFETRHSRNAFHIASDFGISYTAVKSIDELEQEWDSFTEKDGIAILECQVDPKLNSDVFKQVKKEINSLLSTQA